MFSALCVWRGFHLASDVKIKKKVVFMFMFLCQNQAFSLGPHPSKTWRSESSILHSPTIKKFQLEKI